MRRRGFLASLTGIAVASAVQCFGKIEGPKEAAKKVLSKISEAYQNAQYEEVIIWHPQVLRDINDRPTFSSIRKDRFIETTGDRYDFVSGEWVLRPAPETIHRDKLLSNS